MQIEQIFIEILTTLFQGMDKEQNIITLVKEENTALWKYNVSNFPIKQKSMFQADTPLYKWNTNECIKSSIVEHFLIGLIMLHFWLRIYNKSWMFLPFLLQHFPEPNIDSFNETTATSNK